MAKSIESFFAGVLLGASVGAVTALLLAPDKGKRTRKKLSRKLRDVNESIDELVLKSKEHIDDFTDDVENNLSDLAKRGKKALGK